MFNTHVFRIPRHELRFPAAESNTQILKHACGWCAIGDLVWDIMFEEWYCAQCGWREYEATRSERNFIDRRIPRSVGGTGGRSLTGNERLPKGEKL